MIYDALIIGGSVAGISCALVLGSASKKPFMADKKIGVLAHQRASALQDGLYNNAFGIPAGTLGADLLVNSLDQLKNTYPQIDCIENEKVIKVEKTTNQTFLVHTNKNEVYESRLLVIATGNSAFTIEGLEDFVIDHQKSIPSKNRIQLKNNDHLVTQGIYVAGTLAGHRSQLAIAAGSGAMVATDILVLWNDGNETHAHDSIRLKNKKTPENFGSFLFYIKLVNFCSCNVFINFVY
ncbi:FAD-dependent oxidoreductase [Flavobacterium agricola]|uniref:FAD-dependent oxidoreductase n=1 Tax=Flavobacterium agricola TaxID=2870839 RepID=A0ABY6LWY7_9FLAO|nr:FAD-dependent oxidoreductase [Flavobacterium agricola]